MNDKNLNKIPAEKLNRREPGAPRKCKVARSYAPHRFRYVVQTADGAVIAGFNHRGDAEGYAQYVDGLDEAELRKARRNDAPEGYVQLEFVFVRPR